MSKKTVSTWLVSYADRAFLSARERLMESAARHGVDELRPWGRSDLERTSFYRAHRAVLDKPRGGGYWLWKPFIVEEALKEMATGDLLIYSDAGIEIVADLDPLLEVCRDRSDFMLFAGHYDDVGAPGPNVCGKWTKRDCFVAMDCDERRYHNGQLLDASFIVLKKTSDVLAWTREWLHYCAQPGLLTDEPNVCGLPNVPSFIEHRHDQSLLSLLAIRDGRELFRHPSQYGNHLKPPRYREAGEWTLQPYGSKGIYLNSPYGTLLRHHRGAVGQEDLDVTLHRIVPAPPEHVFHAWTDTALLEQWSPLGSRVMSVTADVRTGGEYDLALRGDVAGDRLHLRGTYVEVVPPARLVYSWRWKTRVTVEFLEDENGTAVALRHGSFPSEKLREYHTAAWTDFLERLAAQVTS